MFGKLFRYELKTTAKVCSIAIAVIVFLAFVLSVSATSPMLVGFLMLLYLVATFVVPYILLLFLLTRYYQTVHGNEAYLTHTLPTDAKTIYGVKFTNAALWLGFTTVIEIACVMLVVNGWVSPEGRSVWTLLSRIFEPIPLAFVVVGIVALIVFGTLQYVALGFFSVTVGSNAFGRTHDLLGIIATYLVTSFALVLFNLFGMLFIPFGIAFPNQGKINAESLRNMHFVGRGMAQDFARLFEGYQGDPEVFGLGFFVTSLISIVVLSWFTKKKLATQLRLK